MKNFFIISLILGIFIIPIKASDYPEWFGKLKKIELLKSTFDSVVKLYGEPINPKGNILKEFETPEGTLSISLSTGKCGTEYKKGYDVGAGVVERISFYVNKKSRVNLKKLGLDLSRFKKKEIGDVPGAYYYENLSAGIHIVTDEYGLVEDIDFQPSYEFAYLYCNK